MMIIKIIFESSGNLELVISNPLIKDLKARLVYVLVLIRGHIILFHFLPFGMFL